MGRHHFPRMVLHPLSSPAHRHNTEDGAEDSEALEAGGATEWRNLGPWIFVNLGNTELLQEQEINFKCVKSMRFWGCCLAYLNKEIFNEPTMAHSCIKVSIESQYNTWILVQIYQSGQPEIRNERQQWELVNENNN